MKVDRYAQAAHPESGLFAVRFIPRGQIVAFYSGLVVPCDIDFFALSVRLNPKQQQHGINRFQK